ncbi:MAG TPA: acetyl/propionyl/methylcrotonyl-CoA carboxylase subunit alpha [Hyphomonadaceae bacterium]|jgi:acetyl/propionyl-CoA carboxylase alpha subunit|nr:acetyl/propionyl/methylcrotonyl-CoA carboxylase subunit alpha [Hyphomonadaceae bacterium]
MFSSLLIANRGEISRRIMRTARRLGVRTVAVYSGADAEAAFVREADEAVWIGAAPAAESYLKAERIIEAALDTGADAIHPGYGFLSENAAFAEAVVKAGLTWIGPPGDSIRAMGLKDAAKALMVKHGVPVTPGYHGENQDAKTLKAEAKKIGYPVLIKAIAGGGGRGMRRVDDPATFEAQLTSAQREAKASFGDDRVLVEKFIENPRHIEVQVFGDNHGNYIHLFERDCSLQRRRQKVIEEAPAPGMTDEVRAAMTGAALMAAKAVGYRNAGTVEFIVDGSGALRPDGFWFMEMNTRLQVEHPVTEMVTGLDLVELQFHVATGGKLPAQSKIELHGHAVEARICAEDPAHGFLPSSGRLEVFDLSAFNDEPSGGVTLRLDSAVEEGDEIPPTYDSMIAKAIAHAPTRSQAMDALRNALHVAEIWPVATNTAMLANLLDEDDAREGIATTNLVEANINELANLSDQDEADALILGAAGVAQLAAGQTADPWSIADGFRINAAARSTFVFEIGGEPRGVTLGDAEARIGPEVFSIDLEAAPVSGGVLVSGVIDDNDVLGMVRQTETGPVLFARGRAIALKRPEYGNALEGLAAGDDIRSPMPGKVLEVKAVAGADVKKGDPLVVMEAMKMEHTLTAPRDGKIAEVNAKAGAQTAEGVVLVKLEPLPE